MGTIKIIKVDDAINFDKKIRAYYEFNRRQGLFNPALAITDECMYEAFKRWVKKLSYKLSCEQQASFVLPLIGKYAGVTIYYFPDGITDITNIIDADIRVVTGEIEEI